MRLSFLLIFVSFSCYCFSQNKKPLDHTVYDSWQNIGEKKLSKNGKWVLYTIDVQEGDGILVLQSTDGSYKKLIPRGYIGTITEDSKFAICRIKPHYADSRQAKIQKKKPDDLPKDSLAIIELGKDSIIKIPRIKSYQTPEKAAGWVAWLSEKNLGDTAKKFEKMDSTMKALDSANKKLSEPLQEKTKKKKAAKGINDDSNKITVDLDDSNSDADDDNAAAPKIEEGTDLAIYNLESGEKKILKYVSEYKWSKYGKILVVESTPSKKDSLSKASVMIWRAPETRIDTILRGGNDFKNYAIDDDGYQVAFVAERDSSVKALQKFYKLWYWKNGQDSAKMVLDKNGIGMPIGWTVSENGSISFSKSGARLFMGIAPIQPPKDTALVEFEVAKLDIWNYKDDYLQPMQLKNLDQELKRSYTGMINLQDGKFVQLADKSIPQVILTNEGDGPQFIGITDVGKRIPLQWEGETLKDIYSISPEDGSRKLVKKDLSGSVYASPMGKFILWYDGKSRQYFTWNNGIPKNISSKVTTKLYNEEFDMPDNPNQYGVMGWTQDDAAVFVYDRYDIWKIDPAGTTKPENFTKGDGRKNKFVYRYLRMDPDERFITANQNLLFKSFDEKTKGSSFAWMVSTSGSRVFSGTHIEPYNYNFVAQTDSGRQVLFTREDYVHSPDLYFKKWDLALSSKSDAKGGWSSLAYPETRLSEINPQQKNYYWGTAELFKWKTISGKDATGIVYKPENFDPKKKYPAICYFYEKLSDGLDFYSAPAPTPSRLNIPFYVSRGYIVLAPDISYTVGHPGKSAFDYIVSGARALVKKGWVDSTKIGLQGQSWGGYQVAYLITQTKLFKAAWAGAPVANMTSAYGGIRWESGMNRQFQYEHSQSRIGATLWEKPQLYIENSPLFHLPNVKTPLVIMSNDNDGAVPFYQGIELFTAMRRLGKPVWLLNYNGEAHNLIERRNRKDIQIREQQFFDWLLKGERAPQWIQEGIPATMKGKNWGFELEGN